MDPQFPRGAVPIHEQECVFTRRIRPRSQGSGAGVRVHAILQDEPFPGSKPPLIQPNTAEDGMADVNDVGRGARLAGMQGVRATGRYVRDASLYIAVAHQLRQRR